MAPRSRNRDMGRLLSGSLFYFTALGAQVTALPLYIATELGGSNASVGLATSALAVASVVSRPFAGRGVDNWGHRPFLRIAPGVVAATTLALAAASSLPAVVIIRVLQGLAGSGYYTAAATAATDLAPSNRTADAISRFSLALYGGFTIGPLLGVMLVETLGFTQTWVITGTLAFSAGRIAGRLPDTLGERSLPPHASRPARVLHPAAAGPGLVIAVVATGFAAVQSFAPLYATEVGLPVAGLLYAVFSCTILVFRLGCGRLSDHFGHRAVAVPGLGIGAVGLALLAAATTPQPALVGIALFGVCQAATFPALMSLSVEKASTSDRGSVIGTFTGCFDIGIAIGAVLVGAIVDSHGFAAGWLTPAAGCFLAALGMTAASRRRPVEQHLLGPPPAALG